MNGESRNRRAVIEGIDVEFVSCPACEAEASEEDVRTALLEHNLRDACRICNGPFPFSKARTHHWHFDSRVEWGIIPTDAESKFLVEGMVFRAAGKRLSFTGCVHLECLEDKFGPLGKVDEIEEKNGRKYWRGQMIRTERELNEINFPFPPEPDDEEEGEK